MTIPQYLAKLNNKNARAGNKTFEIQLPSKKAYEGMTGYIIFELNKGYAIVESYPQENRLIFKTQKMLKK